VREESWSYVTTISNGKSTRNHWSFRNPLPPSHTSRSVVTPSTRSKGSSGHSVTLTSYLYLVDPKSKPGSSAVASNLKSHSNLQATLQGSLKSPEFLPDGGTLGFGLVGLYPITIQTGLQEMAGYLKGEDARVYRARVELGPQPSS
jgi:hypothetical protein